MIITNRRKIELELKNTEEFLKFQQEYDRSIIRLSLEIKNWFIENKSKTFSKSELHPQKIRKMVYGENDWFKAASVANLNPYFYYMKGYTKDEATLKIEEMKLKNSKSVKKSFIGLSGEERSLRCDSSSKVFFQNKYGYDWEIYYNYKLDRIYPSRIGYWLDRDYSIEEAKINVSYFQSNAAKKMWDKRNKGGISSPFNTQIEYYLLEGLSKEEAEQALKERQSTFSKEKMITKYGEEEGIKLFNKRQEKWQNSLNSKSDKEKIKIKNKKGKDKNGIPHMGRGGKKYFENYPEKAQIPTKLYYIKFFNENTEFWKIGITARTISERFGNVDIFKTKYNLEYEIILELENTLYECYSIEQRILKKFNNYRITVDINNFRSTECFNRNLIEEIKNDIV